MNEEKTLEVIKTADEVTIPRVEYDELLKARFGIDMIGCTLGKYGPDDSVVNAICKKFGYEFKEETPDA